MTKLVSIVWYKVLPARFGGQKGIACFNKYLSKHLPLVCLCSQNNERTGDLSYKLIPELPVSKRQFLQRSCWQKIKKTIVDEQATHIILEHPYHGIAALRAARAMGARLIVHSHNIESERFRLLGKWWWRMLRWYEGWVHRKADLNLFKTVEDMRWAIDHFALTNEKCMVVPYGIENKQLNKEESVQKIRALHGLNADEKILLFAGTLDYAPNAKAVEDIFLKIGPHLQNNYRIIVCGRNKDTSYDYLKSFSHPQIIMAGEVEDIDTYFSAADAFINPVRTKAGIQTKNLEALAHHCNIVCFDLMVDAGLMEMAGPKFFVCKDGDWDGFNGQMDAALEKSTPTPSVFFEMYGWENILKNLSPYFK